MRISTTERHAQNQDPERLRIGKRSAMPTPPIIVPPSDSHDALVDAIEQVMAAPATLLLQPGTHYTRTGSASGSKPLSFSLANSEIRLKKRSESTVFSRCRTGSSKKFWLD